MTGRISALFLLALIGATGISAPARPQSASAPCRLCGASASENDQRDAATPVRLEVEAKLDFDRLIIAGAGEGSARLSPEGDRSVSGSVGAIGSRAMAGEVTIRGEPGRSIRVDLPERIELYGLAGGTLRLESIRADLPAEPRLDGNGRLSFRFGGVLRVTGDLDGQFRGEIPIDVDYF